MWRMLGWLAWGCSVSVGEDWVKDWSAVNSRGVVFISYQSRSDGHQQLSSQKKMKRSTELGQDRKLDVKLLWRTCVPFAQTTTQTPQCLKGSFVVTWHLNTQPTTWALFVQGLGRLSNSLWTGLNNAVVLMWTAFTRVESRAEFLIL